MLIHCLASRRKHFLVGRRFVLCGPIRTDLVLFIIYKVISSRLVFGSFCMLSSSFLFSLPALFTLAPHRLGLCSSRRSLKNSQILRQPVHFKRTAFLFYFGLKLITERQNELQRQTMLGRSWVMILMVMMERDTAAANYTIVSKFSGESVELLSGRTIGANRDFRWTHLHLLLNNRTTKCYHSRCELIEDGSLRFSKVLAEDSGNYTLEVYDQHGTIIEKKVFFLQVKGSQEETHVYMAMHGIRGNNNKQEEDKREEEPLYVPCNPGVPAELAENIYV
ncbi:uncharacterized protein LOC124876693 isoform X3 [Girardinichthys multiradiatus]|uniref:uncharacterized protein LOC124876693 isoform X3 n=1 Tax=Girardinichthys multiradiatus TaxID=208333 RepID=UPI001FAD13B2|nr:uncharacterized protein LOC124876693 isoform X3 [Girardinichthys multiradiatus]